MTLRIATILGRVRRKLISYNQSKIEDEDILDAGNEIQDDILLEADIERKFDIALVGEQEKYPLADESTFEILNTILSWTGAVQFVPNSEWNYYRTDTGNFPCWFTIFGQELHIAPIPTSAWVASDIPIIECWGRQKKTIVPIDENTDPELPDIFDNALVLGICKEFDEKYLDDYLDAREKAITAYNNKKLGIQPPECEW
jgi:hypothetical protein